MNKNIFFTLLYFLSVSALYSQVGIGTTNPQQELHIAGNSSTIRVEGLNNTNNTNNLGASQTYPIHVNQNGDLLVPPSPSGVVSLINNQNPMGSTINVQTTTNGGGNYQELYHRAFTLTKPALVFVNYSISYDVQNFANTDIVTDGRAKMIQTYVRLGNGTTAGAGFSYGQVGQSYTNSTAATATGYLYNSGTGMVYLTAGTYSFHVFGAVWGGDRSSAAQYSVNFGGSGNTDYINIYGIY